MTPQQLNLAAVCIARHDYGFGFASDDRVQIAAQVADDLHAVCDYLLGPYAESDEHEKMFYSYCEYWLTELKTTAPQERARFWGWALDLAVRMLP